MKFFEVFNFLLEIHNFITQKSRLKDIPNGKTNKIIVVMGKYLNPYFLGLYFIIQTVVETTGRLF
jgi:hypothetical protein